MGNSQVMTEEKANALSLLYSLPTPLITASQNPNKNCLDSETSNKLQCLFKIFKSLNVK